ncbi:hypothetical protein CRG98_040117 [Punica granatum]|uniref:Uncharacterized protein n=1 Tax=Punica granatum TaxID=22663 RepID=A0A2I0I6A5_PUNGR|nr:hypothetical protein CRG98_040117 [Punica granatum]
MGAVLAGIEPPQSRSPLLFSQKRRMLGRIMDQWGSTLATIALCEVVRWMPTTSPRIRNPFTAQFCTEPVPHKCQIPNFEPPRIGYPIYPSVFIIFMISTTLPKPTAAVCHRRFRSPPPCCCTSASTFNARTTSPNRFRHGEAGCGLFMALSHRHERDSTGRRVYRIIKPVSITKTRLVEGLLGSPWEGLSLSSSHSAVSSSKCLS